MIYNLLQLQLEHFINLTFLTFSYFFVFYLFLVNAHKYISFENTGIIKHQTLNIGDVCS